MDYYLLIKVTPLGYDARRALLGLSDIELTRRLSTYTEADLDEVRNVANSLDAYYAVVADSSGIMQKVLDLKEAKFAPLATLKVFHLGNYASVPPQLDLHKRRQYSTFQIHLR